MVVQLILHGPWERTKYKIIQYNTILYYHILQPGPYGDNLLHLLQISSEGSYVSSQLLGADLDPDVDPGTFERNFSTAG